MDGPFFESRMWFNFMATKTIHVFLDECDSIRWLCRSDQLDFLHERLLKSSNWDRRWASGHYLLVVVHPMDQRGVGSLLSHVFLTKASHIRSMYIPLVGLTFFFILSGPKTWWKYSNSGNYSTTSNARFQIYIYIYREILTKYMSSSYPTVPVLIWALLIFLCNFIFTFLSS